MKALVVRVVLTITSWRWVHWVFTGTRIGRRVAMRFVAGESLDDAVAVVRGVNAGGSPGSFNLLGEYVADLELAAASRDRYLECIDRVAAEGLDADVSVKLTQLGLDLDRTFCEEALGSLAKRAASLGVAVTVDMEESAHTDATLDLVEEAQREHGNLGVALQAYLRRTPQDLSRIDEHGFNVRLCKGAYDEPESAAFRLKSQVNAAYDGLAAALMESEATFPGFATHDEGRIVAAVKLAESTSHPYEFQMLYGIRRKLQRKLIEEGLPLRVYVPYGEAWYPYLTRRIAERPANLWFFLRALFGR